MLRTQKKYKKSFLIFPALILSLFVMPQALQSQEGGAQVRHLSAVGPSSVPFTLTYIEDVNSGLIVLIALRSEALTLDGGDVTLDKGIEMLLPPQAKDFNPTPNPDNVMNQGEVPTAVLMANVDEINNALIYGDVDFLSERLVATGTTNFNWVIKFLVTESKSLHGNITYCNDGDIYPLCTGETGRINANHHVNFNNGQMIDSIMIK